MKLLKTDDIFIKEGAISDMVCGRLISYFEGQVGRKISGDEYSASFGSLNALKNRSLDSEFTSNSLRHGEILIVDHARAKFELKSVYDVIEKSLQEFGSQHPGLGSLLEEDFEITKPRIEKLPKSGGFTWHMDSRQSLGDRRFLTWIIYLNDVFNGGEIEFLRQGLRVSPRRGLLLMFSPFWTHVHQGRPPASSAKYTLSSGVCLTN